MAGRGGRRSWWGWGLEDAALGRHERERLAATMEGRFGVGLPTPYDPPAVDDIELDRPRLEIPGSLASVCSDRAGDRAGHCYGKSYRDVVRALRGELEHPPDVVAFPRGEADLVAVLDWCSSVGAAAVPYGGGSSVVGGVECDVGNRYRGAVSIDLGRLERVIEVDRVSSAARIQAGVLGPALEDQLRPFGLTLRHYPQSFEFSTLGGWLATRSAGHYATGPTHIDDRVEALRVVAPTGVLETRRLPGSGAGPSPDRLVLGSEGALGIIVEAWMRLQTRPRFRASAELRFGRLDLAVAAMREIVQSGLAPANCRLLDPGEAALSAGTDGEAHVLLLAFESPDHPEDAALRRCVQLCADHGGSVHGELRVVETDPSSSDTQVTSTSRRWKSAFLRAPYLRDALAASSVIVETFETACTWAAYGALHAGVVEAAMRSAREVCGAGLLTSRVTHLYADGLAPYYTLYAPGRRGGEVSQWDEIKSAVSETILAYGGTVTHHHGIGRTHRPWYDRQRPPLYASALGAAKSVLDPDWILNPGILVDPP